MDLKVLKDVAENYSRSKSWDEYYRITLNMDLKEVVFFRCKAEYDCYMFMKADGAYPDEEIEHQKGRFMSAYQIIEEAELEDEYQYWKEQQCD